MPPGEYNPDNAGQFEAIKMPEQPKSPDQKPQPNYEKLAELKAAAQARREQAEAKTKMAEAPLIDAARKMALEIAVSGSPGKSFMEMSAADKGKLAKDLLAINKDIQAGREAVETGDTTPKPKEKPRADQNAGVYRAITPDQIAAAGRGALAPDGNIMKEVSPMSAQDDAVKMDRQPVTQPPKKKGFFGGLFG